MRGASLKDQLEAVSVRDGLLEHYLLAAIILGGEPTAQIMKSIRAEDFSVPENRGIFSMLKAAWEAGTMPDLVMTVVEAAGGPLYLEGELKDFPANEDGLRLVMFKRLWNLIAKRKVMQAANELKILAFDSDPDDALKILTEAADKFLSIAESARADEGEILYSSAVQATICELQERRRGPLEEGRAAGRAREE
jgi:replicative DNA helicase